MKTIVKYRTALKSLDLGQLRTEVGHLLDQQEQVWAGEREAIDYPIDGEPRRPEWKHSVGPAVPTAYEPRVIKRWPDGSPRRYEGQSDDVAPKPSN